MAWIRTINWEDSEGELRDSYDWQAASLGEPAEFTTLGSIYPAIVDERLRLYRTVEKCPSALSTIERDSAAYVTSLLNGTDHCASGLLLRLEGLGVGEDVLASFDRDAAAVATGDDRLDAICAYAAKLTLNPAHMVAEDIELLRTHGLSDVDLLDLNNIVSYYCYINRVVMGLGLRSVIPTTHEATNAVPAEPHPS